MIELTPAQIKALKTLADNQGYWWFMDERSGDALVTRGLAVGKLFWFPKMEYKITQAGLDWLKENDR